MRHLRRLRSALAGLAAAAAVLGLSAAAAAATSSPTVGLRAVPGPGVHLTHGWYSPTVASGSSVTLHVEIQNASPSTPAVVGLYTVNGENEPSSGIVYSAEQSSGIASWISFSRATITLPPQSTRVLPFTVSVPPGQAPGQYVGGIAAQPQTAPGTARAKGSTFAVNVDTRIVLAVVVEVPGPLHEAYSVGKPQLSGGNGQPAVVGVPISSRGNGLGAPALVVTLSGQGQKVTIRRQLDTILPHSKIDYPVGVGEALAPGQYDVRTCVTYRGHARNCTRSSGTLTSPAPTHATLPPPAPSRIVVVHSGPSTALLLGATIGGAIVFGLIIAGVIVVTNRRRQR